MADLMEVFRKLLAGGALTSDQKAHTLLTACDILSGHGEALHVDTGEFHRQLYAMLGQPSMGGGSGQGGGWTAAMAAAARCVSGHCSASWRGTSRQGLTLVHFQLNLSALYGIGGARRDCVARVKGVFRLFRVFLCVRHGSS
jgi:hypothetical protein